MLRADIIGYLGKDCVVQQHGTDSVINFSLAHTDKYKDASGQKYEKVTWISCSYWVERTTIAQYLKKGTLIYCSGVPEAKSWTDKNGEAKAFLNMRVYSIQLLGGNKDNQEGGSVQTQSSDQGGYAPVTMNGSTDDSDLPF